MFYKVPAGTIKTFFDVQSQPLFKSAVLEKYLGIDKVRDILKEFPSHYNSTSSKIEGTSMTGSFGRSTNPHNVLTTIVCAIEISVRSNKPKTTELVKWLSKKDVEKYRRSISKILTMSKHFRCSLVILNTMASRYWSCKNVGLQDEIYAKVQQIEK